MVEYENERGQYREGPNREVPPKQYEDEVVKGRTNKRANGKGQFNEGPIHKGPLGKGRSGTGPILRDQTGSGRTGNTPQIYTAIMRGTG